MSGGPATTTEVRLQPPTLLCMECFLGTRHWPGAPHPCVPGRLHSPFITSHLLSLQTQSSLLRSSALSSDIPVISAEPMPYRFLVLEQSPRTGVESGKSRMKGCSSGAGGLVL